MLMNNVIDTIPYINKKYKIKDVDKALKYINCWWESMRICPIRKPTKKAGMTFEISTIKDNEEVLFVIRKINGKYRKIPYYKETTIKNLHALLSLHDFAAKTANYFLTSNIQHPTSFPIFAFNENRI